MADRTMAYQRAWKRTHAGLRELDAAHRLDEAANPANEIVGTVAGFLIVRQADGTFTVQRGLRVRGVGEGWSRERAEDVARTLAASVDGR